MKFKTETGTRYEIIDNETIRKNDVFLFNYVLLGSINPRYISLKPKPHLTDYDRLKTITSEFQKGEQLVFQKTSKTGEMQRKLHISSSIVKIRH